ncbi:hypothetical protein K3181_10365 [Qipengyuania sp. YG27]|uniref:Uncharacterized protein n=1 Tax=Qipengyuania mesophila TaxID=2867246 RepID=A0ABS7JW11_9SPHN|nr:hypothetical protein [Qipengyuania mesophila]MBX7501844.1 hypothetical protein [Qipengyuania mesophila]
MTEAEANLRDAIEQNYSAFACIPRPGKLCTSPYRDADKIWRTLTSAPLRELGDKQIGPYCGWAITTAGDDRDYRHFLPRIFELSVTNPSWLGTEPPIIAEKLNLAHWRSWPSDQQASVLQFFYSAFLAELEKHPDEGIGVPDWICGLVTLGEPASRVMERWIASPAINAQLQMASFIVDQARDLSLWAKVSGPFWDDVSVDVRRELAEQLRADQTKRYLHAAAGNVSDEDRSALLEPALSEFEKF